MTSRPEIPRSTVHDLARFERLLEEPASLRMRACQPFLLRLDDGESQRFSRLCEAHALARIDSLPGQLKELARCQFPGATAREQAAFVQRELSSSGQPERCGNWVFFPWENKLVHLLRQDDFFEVITNRNRNKITREEQLRLGTKRVGVVGLSVGAEAAAAIAQEHLCGEIRLADFDRLELSNMNRLSSAVDELHELKAHIVARRIAKMDPYLKIRVFETGVTSGNSSEFLDGLDLLIDECDGLPVKHALRVECQRRGLNLVFAGDERGFLSIEPYASQQDLPLFHGRLDAPQVGPEGYPNRLDYFKALSLWLGGWDAISSRSRNSVSEIGSTLLGYPQLASETRYAAGQIGHVSRRLLLGCPVPAFAGHLDLDELIHG